MLTEIRPLEYFKELVTEAIEHQKVETNEMAEFYISNLLAGFISTNSLIGEPMAIAYLKALGAGRAVRAQLLRQLGDLALFTTGFFSDSLNRKIVDIDYYITMGKTSYGHLAVPEGPSEGDISSVFGELSEKFDLFVGVLTEVSERSRLTSSKDILRVYERWLRTKSSQAERVLRDLGIEPVDISTAPVH